MMRNELSKQNNTLFESIKEIDENGNEFWGTRKLSKVLEYSEFRHFLPVIERAKEACTNSGHPARDHFEDYLEEIIHGKGAKQTYDSVKLSRYACYLIVQNADPGFLASTHQYKNLKLKTVQAEIDKYLEKILA